MNLSEIIPLVVVFCDVHIRGCWCSLAGGLGDWEIAENNKTMRTLKVIFKTAKAMLSLRTYIKNLK